MTGERHRKARAAGAPAATAVGMRTTVVEPRAAPGTFGPLVARHAAVHGASGGLPVLVAMAAVSGLSAVLTIRMLR